MSLLERNFVRPFVASLVVWTSWMLVDPTVWTQAPPSSVGQAPAGGRGGGGGGRGSVSDPTTPMRTERRLEPLNRLTPVTNQMLLNPPPGDWLHWRRTYLGHGNSPLSQINRSNVRNLKVAWAWSLAPGVTEFTPLVRDGITHLPNDSWDQDYAFERVIVNVRVNGRMRKAVVTVGKPGIVEALDAATGEFLYAKDMGTQTIVKSIDPVTGAKTLVGAQPWGTVAFCPTNAGAKSFQAGAYDPATKNYYFTLNEICIREGGGTQPHPDTPDGEPGRVVAVNLETREVTWQHRERSPQSSATLATAGGLVFVGTMDRYFRAYDDRSGKILWETRLNDVPNAFPITYMVDGKQHIAMIAVDAGINGRGHYVGIVPEIGASLPAAGAVLWVWELN